MFNYLNHGPYFECLMIARQSLRSDTFGGASSCITYSVLCGLVAVPDINQPATRASPRLGTTTTNQSTALIAGWRCTASPPFRGRPPGFGTV
jgi:hypothetical protein